MDRNFFTGLILIAALIVLWSILFPSQPPPPAPETPKAAASASAVLPTTPSAPVVGNDSASLAQRFGIFAPLTQGQNTQINVKTDRLKLAVNTKGGAIQPVYLQNFRTHDSLPLSVFPGGKQNSFSVQFVTKGVKIETSDLYFEPSVTQDFELKGGETKTLRLKAALSPTQYLEHVYTFKSGVYDVGYQFNIVGLGEVITDNVYYITQRLHVPQTEKALEKMTPETNVFYRYIDEDVENLEFSKDDSVKTDRPLQSVKWVAFKSQFFTNAIIADKKFESVLLTSAPPTLPKTVRRFMAEMAAPYTHHQTDSNKFTLYYGPNNLAILGGYNVELERIVNLGWGPIRYVALGIATIFDFLANFTSNYGIIIFLLAVIIKLILSPLTYKSYLSAAKMAVVNKMPEIKEIDEKYKDDPTQLQQRKMAFYNQVGVNPLSGCVPLLLQLPILFAMFNFFPQSIELRQEPFLWANDLSTYDSIWDFGKVPLIESIYGDHVSLFTILMTISTLVYTWLQQRQQGANTPAQLKYMSYFMPFIFLGVLNNYSAGLSYYYFVLNVLTIAQTYIMRRMISEEKLHAKLHEVKEVRKKTGPKPKSRFETFLEEQQKRQQQIARDKQQKNDKE